MRVVIAVVFASKQIPSGALLSNLMDLVATFADHIKKECEVR